MVFFSRYIASYLYFFFCCACNLFIYSFAYTVFTRSNAAAFIKFLAFPMWRLFEGGVYFKIIFRKSLTTTITVNHL